MTMRNRSLRSQVGYGLVGYALLLSVAIGFNGYLFNEHAEHLVWESLLHSEMEHFIQRKAADPSYAWPDTETLEMFTDTGSALPPGLDKLGPGLHDEILIEGRQRVVLVRDTAGQRLYMALDVADLENDEASRSIALVVGALLIILAMAAIAAWGVGRLTRPLTVLTRRIAALQPQQDGQRLPLESAASHEVATVTAAFNDYLARHEQFALRERAFIDSASHELRTPIAIIAGASALALDDPGASPEMQRHLERIHGTARDVEQLIGLLLVLAKDPDRLAAGSDEIAVDALLPEIVATHQHLCAEKQLQLVVAALPSCIVIAPTHVVRAAVGNLLRNAIENSDKGTIRISLDVGGLVTIEDPGHGMSADEISRIYARMARGAWRQGSGIGLQLIGRLCAHLGWGLSIDSDLGVGSRISLDLGASLKR